jgi:uncharacterized protein YutE (UPF0331/DUF86 family)
MLKTEVIVELLHSLEDYTDQLEKLRPTEAATWETNVENYWAILHGLQIAIQHVLDIDSHILAGEGLASPPDQKAVLIELGHHGIISTAFSEKIMGMAGFRNLLVHHYGGLDSEKVFAVLTSDLDDFRLFSEFVYTYLRDRGYLDN